MSNLTITHSRRGALQHRQFRGVQTGRAAHHPVPLLHHHPPRLLHVTRDSGAYAQVHFLATGKGRGLRQVLGQGWIRSRLVLRLGRVRDQVRVRVRALVAVCIVVGRCKDQEHLVFSSPLWYKLRIHAHTTIHTKSHAHTWTRCPLLVSSRSIMYGIECRISL